MGAFRAAATVYRCPVLGGGASSGHVAPTRLQCDAAAKHLLESGMWSAAEQESISLSCGANSDRNAPSGVISAILFASYGTPSGTCTGAPGSGSNNNSFAVNASCHAPTSVSVVTQACMGRANCTIDVSTATFGGVDPCDKVVKHLSVAVACNGTVPDNYATTRWLVDYGQEFDGGVNLTFAGATGLPAGTKVEVLLGEQLLSDGSVMSPMRTSNNYDSVWTLAGDDSLDSGIVQHEFIQFRYAEVHVTLPNTLLAYTAAGGRRKGSVDTPWLTTVTAMAWVVQHPVGGTGLNVYEQPCSTSTPNSVYTSTARPHNAVTGDSTSVAWFQSDNTMLNAVWNMTAYTAIVTTLDINVDSQTRQRDLCHIDALITNLEQYALFPTGDYSVQHRTIYVAYDNSTGVWGEVRMCR